MLNNKNIKIEYIANLTNLAWSLYNYIRNQKWINKNFNINLKEFIINNKNIM